MLYVVFLITDYLCSCACNKSWLNRGHTDPLTVTDHSPCRRRAAHFLCTLPIRRTGSIPSCVCVSAAPPRGLDQTEGTSPDPPSGNSVPSSSCSARQTGAPREPERRVRPSSADPSSLGLRPNEPPSQKRSKKNENVKTLRGFIHTVLTPRFTRTPGKGESAFLPRRSSFCLIGA